MLPKYTIGTQIGFETEDATYAGTITGITNQKGSWDYSVAYTRGIGKNEFHKTVNESEITMFVNKNGEWSGLLDDASRLSF